MTHLTTNEVLQEWPKDQRNVAQTIVDKYGEPDELTPSVLIWKNNGPWQATVVTKNATKHTFPMPHTDLVDLKDYRAGKPTPYMEKLHFEQQPDAGDPGRQMVTWDELEAAKAPA